MTAQPQCWMSAATGPKPIAIFYHCLFGFSDPPEMLFRAEWIVTSQMTWLAQTGLLAAASEMHVGINGGGESKLVAERTLPEGAQLTYHGMDCRSENLTILLVEEWVKTHPGWHVLYLHTKGVTAPMGSAKAQQSDSWREGMMFDLVRNWRRCVADLNAGHDIVTSTWLWNAADGTQHIPAGNFLWVTSDFAAKLPSIRDRARIQQDGLGALTSRHEAEVYWGNGPRPNVKSYAPDWQPWLGMQRRGRVQRAYVT